MILVRPWPVFKKNGSRRRRCKTEAHYSTQTLTPANLALCDWGHANIAENLVTNVIGQKRVDLLKQRTVHLEPHLTVYLTMGHISNCQSTHSARYILQFYI